VVSGVLNREVLDGAASGKELLSHHLAVTCVLIDVATDGVGQISDEMTLEPVYGENLLPLLCMPKEEVLAHVFVSDEVEALVGTANEA